MPIQSSPSSTVPLASSITDRAVQLFTRKRRNAICLKVAGHRFEKVPLLDPFLTICSQCRIFQPEYKCKLCKLISHEKCLEKIASRCVMGQHAEPHTLPHRFKPATFMKPTWCKHCGFLIKGLYRQGLECDRDRDGKRCETSVHYDCKELVCNPCGQKHQVNHRVVESRIGIQDFQLVRVLGTGTFSKVYLAKLRHHRRDELKLDQKDFAIKVIKKTNPSVSSDPESALTEKKVLNFGRQYPFLTIAHCCFQSADRLYYVMEYVIGRDLAYHIEKNKKFTEDRTRFYSAEIVLALRFLHKQGVVYRDLKSDNVILDIHGHCKLLDFGLSKELSKQPDMKTRTFCGTPIYISPEIIKELDYGFSVDWWALGVLMFEMLFGFPPFEAQDDSCLDKLYESIVTEDVRIPLCLSDEARRILDGLLTKDPQKRLGCDILEDGEQAILLHPFFLFDNTHRWHDIESKRMPPPYIPSSGDLEEYNDEPTVLTPINTKQLEDISPTEFNGFSFYSESFNGLYSDCSS